MAFRRKFSKRRSGRKRRKTMSTNRYFTGRGGIRLG